MKRIFYILSFMVCLLGEFKSIDAQVTIFQEDFDGVGGGGSTRGDYKFPTGWLLRNVDNKTPNAAVSYVNAAWERMEDYAGDINDSCAFSTSWYTPAGTANDFMWTPAITLPAGTLNLKWRGLAYDGAYRDGYEVRIMTVAPTGGNGTIGNQITNSTVLATIAQEDSTWKNRSVSLNAYAGQTVYIGWRNNSNDQFLLLIDDIIVEKKVTIDASIDSLWYPTEYAIMPDKQRTALNFGGKVSNQGLNNLSSVTLKVNIFDFNENLVTTLTSTALASLTPGNSVLLNTNSWTPPSGIQAYYFQAFVQHSVADGNTTNDSLYYAEPLTIDDTTYARDNSSPRGSLGIGANNGGYLGNQFTINTNDNISSISMLFPTIKPNAKVSACVWNMVAGKPNAIIAKTDTIKFFAGSPNYFTLDIKGGSVALTPGEYVVTAIEIDTTLVLGISNAIFTEGKTWVNWPTNPNGTWSNTEDFGLDGVFIIRPNLGCTPAAAAVSIAASANPTCANTNTTFTATATNGGTAPFYQWKLNGNIVGNSSATYTNGGLTNGNTISCIMVSNLACATNNPASSNIITMSVNSSFAASVSISTSTNIICAGTNVVFTANAINGGAAPSYQWKLNGINVGNNLPTYSNNTLTNGNTISCIMTSNTACATGSPATSNIITMSVNNIVTPLVSIVASQNNICPTTSVTFTATPTSGGTAPTYQWKKNNVNVGTNSNTYTNAAWTAGDQIYCVLTSSLACVNSPTATSNVVTMIVTANTTASVSVNTSSNPACAGTNILFTATPNNGGTAPSYQWKLNGNNIGTNSPIYSNNTLANGNTVSCVMTSNAACVLGSPASSNIITMSITPNINPSISILANANPICAGTNVTFTATPTNGGTTPNYQWKLNGNNVGTNSTTYSNSGLVQGDKVSCTLTSNANCLINTAANSNVITITVTSNPPASVSINASNNPACTGGNVVFTALPTNGGTPSYQWKLNGGNVGTNSPSFSSNTLANANTVSCVMTSSLSCVTGNPATSNTITMAITPNLPVSAAIVSTNNNACEGIGINFSATPTNGGTPSYQWKVNGNNIGTNSPNFGSSTLANGNNVTCIITSSLTCTSGNPATSNTIAAIVKPNPMPIVNITGNILTSSVLGDSYTWYLNGVVIAASNNSTYTATQSGNYSVEVIKNGCSGTSPQVNVTVSGIIQQTQFQKIDIFPNPNNGLMKVVIETPKGGNIDLLVMDVLGKIVAQRQVSINQGRNEFSLDLSELSQNIYFVKTKLNDINYQGKIIIAE